MLKKYAIIVFYTCTSFFCKNFNIFLIFYCHRLCSQFIIILSHNFIARYWNKKSLFFAIINFFLNFIRLRSTLNKNELLNLPPRINLCNNYNIFVCCDREPQQSSAIRCVLYESSFSVGCRNRLGCLASWHFPRELRGAHLRVWSHNGLRSGTHLYQQLFLTGRSGNLQLTFAQHIFHSRTFINPSLYKVKQIKNLITII